MRAIERLAVGLALASLPIVLSGCGPGAVSEDPLDRQIEELIAVVDVLPTSQGNAEERATLLWQWANRYALEGGILPVNLSLDVAYAMNVSEGVPIPQARLAAIDDYVRELAAKRNTPDLLGSLDFDQRGPLTAADWATVELTWTVGAGGMAPGGLLLLGRQLMTDHTVLQISDSGSDGFVSVRSSAAGARFEPVATPLSGMHGGFRRAMPMPTFRLEEGELRPGDSVTLTLGDRTGGGRGLRMQTFSTDRLLVPLYLALEPGGPLLTPQWPALQVVGREPVAIGVVAPSVLRVGEPFELAIRAHDRWFNRAVGEMPELALYLDAKPIGQIPAGRDTQHLYDELVINEPGVHRFLVVAGDGSLEGESNPIWVEEEVTTRVFWGETHGHTGFAEGQGSAESYFNFARDDARLDFVSLSEHDIWTDDAEWRTLQRLTASYAEEGEFLAFLGYEWSVPRARGGHHNVFFRTPDRERVSAHIAPTLPELYAELHRRYPPDDVLIIPHAHQAADWTQNDPELEKLIEIHSMHGTFEWFGNLYLQNGFQVGFVAASDDHRARPGLAHGIPRAPHAQFGGLAAVRTAEKSSEGVWQALRGLSAYATSGQRILLDATLNGHPMGSRQENSERRIIHTRVSGTAPIEQIDVVRNGYVVFSRNFLARPPESHAWLLVGFESSSEVLGESLTDEERDNPRPYRVWKGTIEVRGAQLKGVRPVGLDNIYLEGAEVAADGRVSFHVETRGRRDVILLEVEGAGGESELQFELEETREYGFAPLLARPPATVPATSFTVPVSALAGGAVEQTLTVGQHVDRIRVQSINPGAPLDQELEFVDLDEIEAGDYYYVRVRQLDGGRAWSSPFWVGKR